MMTTIMKSKLLLVFVIDVVQSLCGVALEYQIIFSSQLVISLLLYLLHQCHYSIIFTLGILEDNHHYPQITVTMAESCMILSYPTLLEWEGYYEIIQEPLVDH